MKPRHWPGVTVKYSGLLAATKASVFAVEAKSEGVRPLFQNTEAGTVEGFSPVARMFSARTTGTVCANCHCITGMAVGRMRSDGE
jgi:hypothetical protein